MAIRLARFIPLFKKGTERKSRILKYLKMDRIWFSISGELQINGIEAAWKYARTHFRIRI